MENTLSDRARVALWYAIEEAFGALQYDNFAEPFWTEEIAVLEERVRKRLRILSLTNDRYVPDQVREFITSVATAEQLRVVAEEAILIASQTGRHDGRVQDLAPKVLQAFGEGGVKLQVTTEGRLVEAASVDTQLRTISELPGQPEFKSDLKAATTTLLGLVFLDLDNFKGVNDTLGHQAGDACLETVVKVTASAILGKGRLYRYGGDEFCVILANADRLEAAATGERIRRAIEKAKPGREVVVTASVGVAASDQEGLSDSEELLKAADSAAYMSKKEGKNRVTTWPDRPLG